MFVVVASDCVPIRFSRCIRVNRDATLSLLHNSEQQITAVDRRIVLMIARNDQSHTFLQGLRLLMSNFTALLQFREASDTTDTINAVSILIDAKIQVPARFDQRL